MARQSRSPACPGTSLGHRGICPPPLLLFSRLFLVHLLFLLFPALPAARRARRHLLLRPRLLPGGGGGRAAALHAVPRDADSRSLAACVSSWDNGIGLQSHCSSPGPGAIPLPSPRGSPFPPAAFHKVFHAQVLGAWRCHKRLRLRPPQGRQRPLQAQTRAVRAARRVSGEVAALLPAAHWGHQPVAQVVLPLLGGLQSAQPNWCCAPLRSHPGGRSRTRCGTRPLRPLASPAPAAPPNGVL